MSFQPERENSMFIYHEEIAKQLNVIFGNTQSGYNKEEARRLLICNIVYARSLVEELEVDKNDLPKIEYVKILQNEDSLEKLIAEMVRWQKLAKLTPQIMSTFGTSYYSKMKKSGAFE